MLAGLAVVSQATIEDKARFAFALFDFNDVGPPSSVQRHVSALTEFVVDERRVATSSARKRDA